MIRKTRAGERRQLRGLPDDDVLARFRTAQQLAHESNAYWQAKLGDPGLLGGFQVEPLNAESNGSPAFVSILYGGRCLVGTAEELRAGSREYVDSRRRRGTPAVNDPKPAADPEPHA